MVNIDDTGPIDYYLCYNVFPLSFSYKHLASTTRSNRQCQCGRTVNWKMPTVSKNVAGKGKNGVFVKGKMRYMVTDDLQVSPVCMAATLELLKRLGIRDATVLEERNVNLGSEEVLHLLKHSLLSKTPLTDVFLPVQDTIDRVTPDLKVMFNLPLSDLEERVVSVGEEEALSLLKASLISNTVLSDAFLKKPKQLGRRSSLYS
ncbi:hypothetical protein AAC387_Pa12g1352 [Persea americana]